MMSVSIITPWPPQPTGIADYAFDLVKGLHALGVRICVWTDCDQPVPLTGIPINRIDNKCTRDLEKSDLLIYQMGNNTHFHLYMIDLLKQFKGIVHLHDIVLHHLMAWLTWQQGDVHSYLDLIEKWYGPIIRNACEALLRHSVTPWDSEIVTEIPLFQEVLQYADACIVHSRFAKDTIEMSLPHVRIYKIEQIYEIDNSNMKTMDDGRLLRIGVFGGVDPQKLVDICIEVFAEILKTNDKCELHIVGSIDKRCESLTSIPKQFAIESKVIFHRRVSNEEFHALLSNMDVLIALRHPTMGETSAIVMRAMQKGIPVIVNRTGWYAELPDFVDKIEVGKKDNMKSSLLNILLKYQDFNYLIEKKEAFKKYAAEHLCFQKSIAEYQRILVAEYDRKLLAGPYIKFIETIEDMNMGDENPDNDRLLRNILMKTSIMFHECYSI